MHSTETAAILLTDTIRRNIDQGLLTGAVFIDLSKAFDTVDHALHAPTEITPLRY